MRVRFSARSPVRLRTTHSAGGLYSGVKTSDKGREIGQARQKQNPLVRSNYLILLRSSVTRSTFC
jgi:hypothetical protein